MKHKYFEMLLKSDFSYSRMLQIQQPEKEHTGLLAALWRQKRLSTDADVCLH